MKKTLIVIGGPTASGKTSLSIQLALHYNCPILSADSRQFYKEMNIGTAKPTKVERELATHHFIDNLSINDDYSVGQYESEVIQLLDKLYKEYDVAIVVGGTGLYLNAIMDGIDTFPSVPTEIRKHYAELFDRAGIEILQNELRLKDPEYYTTVDIYNHHRLIRALSLIKASGQKFSEFRLQNSVERSFYSIPIAITMDRNILYNRIERRVDQMIEDGLIEEARSLYPMRTLNALNTVGYKELFRYFDGEWTEEQAINKIKQHTRNYAKRQMTWFRNQGDWHPVSATDIDEALAHISTV